MRCWYRMVFFSVVAVNSTWYAVALSPSRFTKPLCLLGSDAHVARLSSQRSHSPQNAESAQVLIVRTPHFLLATPILPTTDTGCSCPALLCMSPCFVPPGFALENLCSYQIDFIPVRRKRLPSCCRSFGLRKHTQQGKHRNWVSTFFLHFPFACSATSASTSRTFSQHQLRFKADTRAGRTTRCRNTWPRRWPSSPSRKHSKSAAFHCENQRNGWTCGYNGSHVGDLKPYSTALIDLRDTQASCAPAMSQRRTSPASVAHGSPLRRTFEKKPFHSKRLVKSAQALHPVLPELVHRTNVFFGSEALYMEWRGQLLRSGDSALCSSKDKAPVERLTDVGTVRSTVRKQAIITPHGSAASGSDDNQKDCLSRAFYQHHAGPPDRVLSGEKRGRLTVTLSNNHVHACVVDNRMQKTYVYASSFDKCLLAELGAVQRRRGSKPRPHGGTMKAARAVGRLVAQRAMAKGIKKVFFDRKSYRYTGRVKALADGAREGGLEF